VSVAIAIKNCRLKYLSQLNMGQSPPSEAVTRFDEGDGLPFLQGNAEFGAVSPSYKHTCNNPPKAAMTGDMLVSVRAPVGALNIADQPYGIGRGLCAVKWIYIEPRFGWWALHHHRSKLNEVATGSTYEAVSAEDLGNLVLSFPDEQLQCFIANYLDRETARIDELIAEKERMLALLEEKCASLISRVVTRGLDPNAPLKPSGQQWLGEIPAHWNICQLKRTWASSDYGLSESIRDEGEIAVLRMSCIVDGRIDVSKSGMIAEVDDHLLLRRNDLLFNRTNSLDQIAKVGLVDFDPDEPLTFASYLVRIRANLRATPQYLVALLNSSLFLEFARKNAIPAIGQANLSPTRYGEIQIPLPPMAEQDEIVTFLERDAATSTPVREYISSSIALLKERRAALISAAVTGQIPLEEMTG